MPIITLLTDYGITDSYVAEVKGAILKINDNVTIVDISHDVGNYDIASGAFHLARSVPYFPDGTIHVGVVDPGVGSSRKAIIIRSNNAWFVGPDNGLLAPAAERLGIERVWEITNKGILPPKVSDVFDGRDIFGPTGALLSKGLSPDEIGEEINEYVRLGTYKPKIIDKVIEATIIHVDSFGNLVTNVTYEDLERMGISPENRLRLTVREKAYVLPYVRRFSAVPKGEPLMLVAGGGYLEISVNQGDASKYLSLSRGKRLKITVEK
jgi:S-adenosylmethionine hydrolase